MGWLFVFRPPRIVALNRLKAAVFKRIKSAQDACAVFNNDVINNYITTVLNRMQEHPPMEVTQALYTRLDDVYNNTINWLFYTTLWTYPPTPFILPINYSNNVTTGAIKRGKWTVYWAARSVLIDDSAPIIVNDDKVQGIFDGISKKFSSPFLSASFLSKYLPLDFVSPLGKKPDYMLVVLNPNAHSNIGYPPRLSNGYFRRFYCKGIKPPFVLSTTSSNFNTDILLI